MKQRKIKKPETQTHWGSVADWYDQLVGESGSEYHREVVLPGVLRLLAPEPNQHILDVACGQGVLARLLAAKGARVTGVDASMELIKLARERSSPSPGTPLSPSPCTPREGRGEGSSSQLTFHVADARDLSFLPENDFDSAACVLAIQNIHPIAPVFQTVARALKSHGRLALVMMHPAFRGPKETAWGWDDQHKIQYRRIDRYLIPRKAPITAHPGAKTGEYTWSFHKPIESYVKALRNAGLFIDALEEWPSHKTSTSGPRAAAENTARKEIPLFLAMRAVKVPLVQSPSTNEQ